MPSNQPLGLNERRNLLTLALLLAFMSGLFAVDWQKGMFHSGGLAAAERLFGALVRPDFSVDLLWLAAKSSLLTFSYALISLSLAVVGGFVLAVFASGVLFRARGLQRSARAVLGALRAVHELIWAWFFVAAVGLSPLGALFALAIPYAGYLGKIFADTLQAVPSAPISAMRQSGADRWQCFCYAYLPQALPTMLSYTLYRLECAVRSSSVLSFVGLGGIGMQIQLSLQDLRYEQVWTLLLFLVVMILLIDRWSYALRRLPRRFLGASGKAVVGLMGLAWLFILYEQPDTFASLFNPKNLDYLLEFLAEMVGVGETLPAYLDPQQWQNALWLSIDTFAMSLLATGLATVAMLIFVLPAARHLGRNGQVRQGLAAKMAYALSRFLFLFSRSVPELMWAMILVFIFKPSVFTGALALAIHNFGVLGKLCAEVLEEMDDKPLRHLSQNGASPLQLLLYGIYPSVIRPFLNYILYRMENIIRATLIVGFVGASGLGMQFKLAMSYFHYSEITLYLLCYLLLVYATDLLSAMAKRFIQPPN